MLKRWPEGGGDNTDDPRAESWGWCSGSGGGGLEGGTQDLGLRVSEVTEAIRAV